MISKLLAFQVSVVDELGIPVKFVGVGEGVDDLQPFNAEEFVNAIFPWGMIQWQFLPVSKYVTVLNIMAYDGGGVVFQSIYSLTLLGDRKCQSKSNDMLGISTDSSVRN